MKLLCLVSGLFLMLSCSSFPESTLFSWGDTDVRYVHDEKPEVLSGKAFRYPVWRGEKAFAQAVLWSEEDLRNVSVRVSDLVGECGDIPASSVKARFVRYVWADDFIEGYGQCGYRPKGEHDSLSVADMVDIAVRTDVPARHCQPVWVSVNVPQGTAAGVYSGTIEVRKPGLAALTLPLQLQVADETLPAPKDWKFHLDLWQNPYSVARFHGVEPWSEEHFEYMRPVMQLLADAGQKVITATILDRPWNGQTEDPYGSMVTKTRKKNGSWEYGYEVFDKWVEFMMSLGIDRQINCYSMIPWRLEFDYFDESSGQMTFMTAEPWSNEYKLYWGSFISDFAAHLREKGWFEKTCIAMDERPAESMQAAFEVIRSVEPDFKVSLAGNWHPEIEAQLYDYCVAFRQDMPRDERDKRHEEGKVSTYYTCCAERYPNIFTVSPLAEAVWIPWHALAKGYDGYLRWAYNHWTADPLNDTRFRTWTAGDCYYVYPEGRSSLRFDKLVEGIQDYEKARILRERWTAEGDTRRLQCLEEALAAFDYATITREGAQKAVQNAKAVINAPKVIFDTDIGGDIDDVLALQMLVNYHKRGVVDLEGVIISKINPLAVKFTDGFLRWNGVDDVQLGHAKNGVSPEDFYYMIPTLSAKVKGKNLLSPADGVVENTVEGYVRMRHILASAPEHSVKIITVGSLTNIANLLKSGPDEISSLTGLELVKSKVTGLFLMGGEYTGTGQPECNITLDLEASGYVFENWPIDIVASGFEVGSAVHYPAESVMSDFEDPSGHPMCVAYMHWGQMPYDRPTWDLTSVLDAIEPDNGYFSYSEPGKISVDDDGVTTFSPGPGGRHRYLILSPSDREMVKDTLIKRVSGK